MRNKFFLLAFLLLFPLSSAFAEVIDQPFPYLEFPNPESVFQIEIGDALFTSDDNGNIYLTSSNGVQSQPIFNTFITPYNDLNSYLIKAHTNGQVKTSLIIPGTKSRPESWVALGGDFSEYQFQINTGGQYVTGPIEQATGLTIYNSDPLNPSKILNFTAFEPGGEADDIEITTLAHDDVMDYLYVGGDFAYLGHEYVVCFDLSLFNPEVDPAPAICPNWTVEVINVSLPQIPPTNLTASDNQLLASYNSSIYHLSNGVLTEPSVNINPETKIVRTGLIDEVDLVQTRLYYSFNNSNSFNEILASPTDISSNTIFIPPEYSNIVALGQSTTTEFPEAQLTQLLVTNEQNDFFVITLETYLSDNVFTHTFPTELEYPVEINPEVDLNALESIVFPKSFVDNQGSFILTSTHTNPFYKLTFDPANSKFDLTELQNTTLNLISEFSSSSDYLNGLTNDFIYSSTDRVEILNPDFDPKESYLYKVDSDNSVTQLPNFNAIGANDLKSILYHDNKLFFTYNELQKNQDEISYLSYYDLQTKQVLNVYETQSDNSELVINSIIGNRLYLSIEINTTDEENNDIRTYNIAYVDISVLDPLPISPTVLIQDIPELEFGTEFGLPFKVDESSNIIIPDLFNIVQYSAPDYAEPEVVYTPEDGKLIIGSSSLNDGKFFFVEVIDLEEEGQFYQSNIQVYPQSQSANYPTLDELTFDLGAPFIFLSEKDGYLYVSGPSLDFNYKAVNLATGETYVNFLDHNLTSTSEDELDIFGRLLFNSNDTFLLLLLDEYLLDPNNLFTTVETVIPLTYTPPVVTPAPQPSSGGGGASGSKVKVDEEAKDELTYAQEVAKILELGIVTKEPTAETNKCEALIMMSRAFKWTVPTSTSSKFTDVPEWCISVTAYATERGIVQGRTATLLGLETPVTRDEVALMLYRELTKQGYKFTGTTKASFTDQITPWASEAIQKLSAEGIIKGFADGNFKGASSILKQDLGVMLLRTTSNNLYTGADKETSNPLAN